jgi:hypothetical protein
MENRVDYYVIKLIELKQKYVTDKKNNEKECDY